MKQIISILMLFSLFGTLHSQSRKTPVIGSDNGGGDSYLLWQFGLAAGSIQGSSTPAGTGNMILKTANINYISFPVDMRTPDGYGIIPLRVLDTLNGGDSLLNSLFPRLAVRTEGQSAVLDGFLGVSAIDLGEIDIDSTASKRIILRNEGNSVLYLSNGVIFDTTSGTLLDNQDVGYSYIFRGDTITNSEIQWQVRQAGDFPVQGEPLDYADSSYDDLILAIAPGDTAGFYIDARPVVVGSKSDTLLIAFTNGFRSQVYKIPLLAKAAWTLDYKVSTLRARPSTPSLKGEFLDTIKISNNKGARTRISSMRLTFRFDPQNVYITTFDLNPDFFPAAWKYKITDINESEKEGILAIEAYAEENATTKLTAETPEDLTYFTAGSNGEEVVLGVLRGIKLLGTSDTTFVQLDQSLSQHNFSAAYLMDRDSLLVADGLPYMRTVGGYIISDSLLFGDKLSIGNYNPAAIVNMYPNPASGGKFVTVVVRVERSAAIDGELLFIDPYTGATKGASGVRKFKPGMNVVIMRVPKLRDASYYIALRTDKIADAQLLNIMK